METTTNIAALRGAGLSEKEKLRLQRAVKDFEAIFVGQMLKSMRSSLSTTGMFGDSFGGDVMEGVFDIEFAQHMSGSSSFGLAEMLYKQITGDDLTREPKRLPVPVPAPRTENRKIPESIPFPKAAVQGKTLSDRLQQYETYINEASSKFGLDRSLIKAVIAAESAARADALSNKNAKGLMQLIDSTAVEVGVRNVWDPKENIHGGSKYLKKMLDLHDGDVSLALAAYNAGPGTVNRYNGIPPFPETKAYIERVFRYQRNFTEQEQRNNENN
jgi:Rod binding domain-containing protein